MPKSKTQKSNPVLLLDEIDSVSPRIQKKANRALNKKPTYADLQRELAEAQDRMLYLEARCDTKDHNHQANIADLEARLAQLASKHIGAVNRSLTEAEAFAVLLLLERADERKTAVLRDRQLGRFAARKLMAEIECIRAVIAKLAD